MSLVRAESDVCWELRVCWVQRRRVRLTLTDRCVVPRVIGRVTRVAPSGAFAVCDGWHIPVGEILAIGHPVLEEVEAYANERAAAEERGREEGWWV